MQEMRVQSLGQEDPLEEEMATQSVHLPGKSPQRNLACYSPWTHKESEMTEQLSTQTHTHIFMCICVFITHI